MEMGRVPLSIQPEGLGRRELPSWVTAPAEKLFFKFPQIASVDSS